MRIIDDYLGFRVSGFVRLRQLIIGPLILCLAPLLSLSSLLIA